MKIYRLLSPFLVLLFISSINGQAQEFKWLQSPSPDSYSPPISDIDAAGNLYLTGVFTSTATFGSTTLTTPHFNAPYLAKYDRKGNVRWATSLATDQNFGVVDMAVTETGDVYILGSFEDTLILNGITLINPKIETDPYSTSSFIAKLKRKGGGLIWASVIDGSPSEIATDGNENVYVSGNFIKSMQLGSIVLEDTSEWDSFTFLAKYNTGGQLSWAVKSINSTYFNYPQLSVMDNGVATLSWTPGYISPIRHGNIRSKTNATKIVENYNGGTYNGRFTADGQTLWMRNAQTPVEGYYFQTGLATDEYGRIYVSGSFAGVLSFGADTLRSAMNPPYTDEYGEEMPESFREEIYVAKLNKRGEVLWVKTTSSSSGANGSALSLAPDGEIWLAGNFHDTLQIGNQTATSTGGQGLFITHLTNNGQVNWITATTGSVSNPGLDLASDNFGNCFVSGMCSVGATFGDFTSNGTNFEHPFLTRIINQPIPASRESNPAMASNALESGIRLDAFPNPFTDQIVLTLDSKATSSAVITISDLSGRVMVSQAKPLNSGNNQVQLDLSKLQAGAYLVTVTSNGQNAHTRLIKQ